MSPEIELSEIWGDTIVALFQILEFPWGDSIGALFKNSRSILHISTLQIRLKIAKFFSRLRRDLPFEMIKIAKISGAFGATESMLCLQSTVAILRRRQEKIRVLPLKTAIFSGRRRRP